MGTPSGDTFVRASFFLPRDLLERLKVAASRRHVSAAHLVRRALEQALGGYRPPPRGGFLP